MVIIYHLINLWPWEKIFLTQASVISWMVFVYIFYPSSIKKNSYLFNDTCIRIMSIVNKKDPLIHLMTLVYLLGLSSIKKFPFFIDWPLYTY